MRYLLYIKCIHFYDNDVYKRYRDVERLIIVWYSGLHLIGQHRWLNVTSVVQWIQGKTVSFDLTGNDIIRRIWLLFRITASAMLQVIMQVFVI